MNLLSFNPEENLLMERDVLSVFQKDAGKGKKKEIHQGMSPQAIAEIVSDHLIEVVKDDFKEKIIE